MVRRSVGMQRLPEDEGGDAVLLPSMCRGQVILSIPERISAWRRSVSGVEVTNPVGAPTSHPNHYVSTVHGMEIAPWCPGGSSLHRRLCHRLWLALGFRFTTLSLGFTFRLSLGFRLWLSLWLWFWFSLWFWLRTRSRVWRRFCGCNGRDYQRLSGK